MGKARALRGQNQSPEQKAPQDVQQPKIHYEISQQGLDDIANVIATIVHHKHLRQTIFNVMNEHIKAVEIPAEQHK